MSDVVKCPYWATSMVNNYRHQYKDTYKADTTLSDDEIFAVIQEVFDTSPSEEDAARVEYMHDIEQTREGK